MDTTTIPFYKNKVFWTGLLSAVALVVQQLLLQNDGNAIDWPAIGLAALIAGGGYVATTLRGQNMSVWVAIIGNIIWAGIEVYNTGDFTWDQFAKHAIIAVIGFVMPDAKPVGYERDDNIKKAKVAGQIVTPNALVDNKIRVEATQAKQQAGGDIPHAVEIAKSK